MQDDTLTEEQKRQIQESEEDLKVYQQFRMEQEEKESLQMESENGIMLEEEGPEGEDEIAKQVQGEQYVPQEQMEGIGENNYQKDRNFNSNRVRKVPLQERSGGEIN